MIGLITLSNLVTRQRKSTIVEVADVRRVYTLFLDEKRSVQFLTEHSALFISEDGTSGLGETTGDQMETA